MPKLVPDAAKREARRLRQHGTPFKQIAARLNVSVASAHLWSRDIVLTEEQRRANLRVSKGPQSPEHIALRTAAWSARCHARRLEFQLEGREHARRNDPLHLEACMLYWAEGAKSCNTLKFANSDVEMTALFRRFLVECLAIDYRRIRRLIFGVCTLTVSSTRAIQHIYGAIQEYAAVDKPEWLLPSPRHKLVGMGR